MNSDDPAKTTVVLEDCHSSSNVLAVSATEMRAKNLQIFKIARVLVGFDHVARVTRSAAKLEGLSQQLKLKKAIL